MSRHREPHTARCVSVVQRSVAAHHPWSPSQHAHWPLKELARYTTNTLDASFDNLKMCLTTFSAKFSPRVGKSMQLDKSSQAAVMVLIDLTTRDHRPTIRHHPFSEARRGHACCTPRPAGSFPLPDTVACRLHESIFHKANSAEDTVYLRVGAVSCPLR